MTRNVLLAFCRNSYGYAPKQVAEKLGLTLGQYGELERGERPLTNEMARALGILYNGNTRYFLEAARQLDNLLSSQQQIKILLSDNERLSQKLQKKRSRVKSSSRKKRNPG